MQKRPKIVSLLAGWLVLCSVVGAAVFTATLSSATPIQTDGDTAQWIVERLGRGGLLAVTLTAYVIAGSVGFGLWKLRHWGRLGILVVSVVLVAVSFIVGAIVAIKAHQFDTGALVLAVVFGWPLYYFNRPRIKALFT